MAASTTRPDGSQRADEPSADDVDRLFRTLMEGLRTTLPGTTVLLGFLLVLPFQTSGEFAIVPRWLYLGTFTAAALATSLLIAPAVHQRVRAPISGVERNHGADVHAAVRVTLVGTACLALAIIGSTSMVVLATDGGPLEAACALLVAGAIGYTWLFQPLVTFGRGRHGDAGEDAGSP